MHIGPNKVITIAYELRENGPKGELMERMDNNYPFEFLFGNGNLLPAFEKNLLGLTEEQTFSFLLSVEEAYGPVLPENIIEVDIELFRVDGEIAHHLLDIGGYVALTDLEGNAHNGKVLAVEEATVKVDFNHAMVGKQLYFEGVVLRIRTAEIEEIQRGHHIPENGLRS